MAKEKILQVKESKIKVISKNDLDYISLTDMTGGFNEGSSLIGKWITNKNTLEYLGVWENLKNPNFNYPEFDVIKNEAGVNRFVMSVEQWVERTNAIGMIVKAGRYGGTYAHKDIAFHFAINFPFLYPYRFPVVPRSIRTLHYNHSRKHATSLRSSLDTTPVFL